MNKRRQTKAQSAMEYLMTYGWAILVIAIIVGLLFALGLFNLSSNTPTECTPQLGFTCYNPSYTPNGISVSLSQTGAQNYYNAWAFIASASEDVGSSGLPVNFSESSTSNMVKVGTLTPSQVVSVNFLNPPYTAAGDIPTANIPVGTSFTGYIWLAYCTSPICPNPTNFAKVGTINVRQGGAALSGVATTTTGISSTTTAASTSSTSSTSTISTSTTTSSSTTSTVLPTQYISSDTTLRASIVANENLVIGGGVTLTTDGSGIIISGTFTNNGFINTGQVSSYAPGSSYSGSGGGGGGGGNGGGYGQNGGSTLVRGGLGGGSACCSNNGGNGGNGTTQGVPVLSQGLIQAMGSNPSGYLSGAYGGPGAGGNCGGTGQDGQNGGTSAYGLYIQAYSIALGNVTAIGGNGGTATYGSGAGGGGGGGGTVVVAYNASGTLTATGSQSYSGGLGGYGNQNCQGQYSGGNGGPGGGGHLLVYQWTTPPITP